MGNCEKFKFKLKILKPENRASSRKLRFLTIDSIVCEAAILVSHDWFRTNGLTLLFFVKKKSFLITRVGSLFISKLTEFN